MDETNCSLYNKSISAIKPKCIYIVLCNKRCIQFDDKSVIFIVAQNYSQFFIPIYNDVTKQGYQGMAIINDKFATNCEQTKLTYFLFIK